MADSGQDVQRKYQQFVQLMPLTLQIAGLPLAEPAKQFNDDQMENRCKSIVRAYKHAKQLVRDICQD